MAAVTFVVFKKIIVVCVLKCSVYSYNKTNHFKYERYFIFYDKRNMVGTISTNIYRNV